MTTTMKLSIGLMGALLLALGVITAQSSDFYFDDLSANQNAQGIIFIAK